VLILCAFVTIGSVGNHGFVPLSSGGIGISPDLFSPLYLVEPESFQYANENLSEKQEAAKELAHQNFLEQVVDGAAGVIRGVYVEEKFALPVVQQPAGQAGFVSTTDGVATQFGMPSSYGVTGLLAHNFLSGQYFFSLNIGDEIEIVYGNGEVQRYQVADIQKYQALQPNSATSQFRDLFTDSMLSSSQLFKKVYMGSHHLTLQTCIQEGSVDSWGRMFIIAYPI